MLIKIPITLCIFLLFLILIISCKSATISKIKIERNPTVAYGCAEGDCANGFGTFTWENGSRYIGEFKNGSMHGHGTFYFGEGSISAGGQYLGEFKNGFIDGYGIWTWTNGDKYVGECKYNKMHGKGTYYYSDGAIKKGTWINDKYVEEK